MGYHRLPPIASRLRLNRSFDSAWFADPAHYAKLLQKDWILSRAVQSFVQRSSRWGRRLCARNRRQPCNSLMRCRRTLPRAQLTKEQQLLQLSEQRRMMEGGVIKAAAAAGDKATPADAKTRQLKDYPNFRVGR